jgi:hypothetical protein
MRRAECCWITKSSGPLRASATTGAGSGVALKLRLAEYSLSLLFAMPDSKKLLAGASGYSFKEWRGGFYPEKIKPEEMLPFYSQRLPTVEINNTFYQMPKAAVLENWARSTPESFKFAIKASRRITHMSRLKADTAADSVKYLYRNLEVLGPKRGPVLYQLPPFLKKDLPRLAEFLALLPAGHAAASSATKAGSSTISTMHSSVQAPRSACPSVRTTPRPHWSKPRPGATSVSGLKHIPTMISRNGREGSRQPAGARSTSISCTNRPRPPTRKRS